MTRITTKGPGIAARLAGVFLIWLVGLPDSARAEEPEAALPLPVQERWTGDLDGMIERRQIRFLVVYNKLMYFLDGCTLRGGSYELIKLFETELNARLGDKDVEVRAIFIPVTRDQLIPALLDGRGDVAAAQLTVTEGRARRVDFSEPFNTGIRELVVTGPYTPEPHGLEDLSGRSIHVRPSSSYHESLKRLNRDLAAAGKAPVRIVPMPDVLEDSDLLEMVDAGLIPAVVVDEHRADFWAEIFPWIRVHRDLAVRIDGTIGWAFRKDSPQLKSLLDGFAREHRKGTLMGNILHRRYQEQNPWVRNSTAPSELEKFNAVLEVFQRYAGLYDFDWLMIAAMAYQESGLDHAKRSPEGAEGIMQILPATAADPNVDIPDIGALEDNVHAGIKYLRFLYDRYFADEDLDDLDKMLFTFAAYNAGPGTVRKLRDEAAQMGMDPARWFGSVELAAAKTTGRETVEYVSNIYKYYTAYRLILDQQMKKADVQGG